MDGGGQIGGRGTSVILSTIKQLNIFKSISKREFPYSLGSSLPLFSLSIIHLEVFTYSCNFFVPRWNITSTIAKKKKWFVCDTYERSACPQSWTAGLYHSRQGRL